MRPNKRAPDWQVKTVALTYLANNGRLNETARELGENIAFVAARVKRAGLYRARECPSKCCTASQSEDTLHLLFDFAATMSDQDKVKGLASRIQKHFLEGKHRLLKIDFKNSRRWRPRRRKDGTFPWWEYANGDPETGEVHNAEVG